MPWRANGMSAASKTWTWPISQTARLPSSIVPGTSESAVVVTAQVAPTAVSAVALHGTANVYGKSATVPASGPAPPLARSVILTTARASRSPV